MPSPHNFAQDSSVLIGTTKFKPLDDIKNILITGGAGFIASYVVRHFVIQYPEYNIICFDKLDYCATVNNFAQVNNCPNFKFVRGDITDSSHVLEVMRANDIDAVMHFAAQSHVDLSFGNSYSFTHNNVMGTHVLLESAKYLKVKLFLHVSTDEVYGEVSPDVPDLLETSILSPTNPYSASKAAAEMLVNAYYKSFKIPVIIVRSNNVYGPHQYPEKVIPKFLMLLNRGKKMTLHGDGSNTRRYLFAGDAADAFDTIFHKGQVGQIYNVGSSDEISNKKLSLMLLKECGIDEADAEQWTEYTHDRPFNDHRYAVDGSKLESLGYYPKTSFKKGLSMTGEWYKKFGEIWWGDIGHCLSAFPDAYPDKSK